MKPDQIVSAVLEYLDLIENGRESEEANIAALEELLDRLALAQHYVQPLFEEHPDPPSPVPVQFGTLAGERFPSFGLYNIPDPITKRLGEPDVTMGWALDDVTDISRDLWKVRWRLHHTSQNDALYEFVESYWIHWGRHLRYLQFYLQGRRDD